MKTPEEFAQALGITCDPCVVNPDEPIQYIACLTHDAKPWDGEGASEDFCAEALRLIRTRDAQVTAVAWFEALEGFTKETRSRDDGYAGWASGQGMVSKPPTRERRLVGPWEVEDV